MEMSIKEKRRENKRRKVAALLEICDLNEKDRQAMTPLQSEISSDEPEHKRAKIDDRTTNPSDEGNNEDATKPKYSEKELEELRMLLKQRNREKKKTPFLYLKEPTGFQAELDVPPSDRVPVFFSDIQHLVLFSTLAQNSPFFPRWCHLEKCGHLSAVQILFIEGAGISDYLQCEEKLPSLSKSKFPFHLEVVMPSAYGGNLIEEFCAIPLSRNQGNNIMQAYGSLEKAVNSSCEVFKILRAFFPVDEKGASLPHKNGDKKQNQSSSDVKVAPKKPSPPAPRPEPLPKTDKFSRTHLLLSAWQMIEEGFPIPLNAALKEKYKDFVPTKPLYKEVNNFSPMYAVDCEMCTTIIGKSECTRVSIVNEKLETVIDTLVLPYNKITNYLTRYSGITAAMMKNVTTRLEDVQKFIQETLEPDAILVGQSLNNDLVALKMMHPYCIDTSVIFNVTGDRYRKSKLKYLAEHFLNESIQTGHQGHCSVEDSSASLKLVQLKLSKSLEFGDQVLSVSGINKIKKTSEIKEKVDLSGYATSLFSYATRMGKHASILAAPEILEKYMDYLNPRIASYEQLNEDGSCKTIAKEEISDTGRVTCVISSTNQAIVEGAAAKVFNNFLTIGHIKLTEAASDALALRKDETVEELNNMISHMHKTALMNSLSIVVMCGREKSSNGICFINLHKKVLERVQYKPGVSVQ